MRCCRECQARLMAALKPETAQEYQAKRSRLAGIGNQAMDRMNELIRSGMKSADAYQQARQEPVDEGPIAP